MGAGGTLHGYIEVNKIALGAQVIATAGGAEKCAWVRELGADHVIDYKAGPVLKQLYAAAPDGIDIYFDNVGGEILDAALANLRRGARVILCGAIASYNATTPPPGPRRYMSLLVNRARMQGFLVFDYPEKDAAAIASLAAMAAEVKSAARRVMVPPQERWSLCDTPSAAWAAA